MAALARQASGGVAFSGSPDAGERAFAYAKACGIIGKSFVGKRIPALGKIGSLNELDRLVFPEVFRELPGRELLSDLERRILRRTTQHILAVIDSYSNPPELLVRQLRSCEYADLKTCLHHIASGRTAPPMLSDIGRFRTVCFDAYPDLAAMLAGSEFDFILAKDLSALKSPGFDLTPLEAELDLRYYTLLTASVRRLSAEDRLLAEQILAEEISLRNCVWALRLRTYFDKTPEETAEYLMDIQMPQSGALSSRAAALAGANPGKMVSLAAEARKLLDFPLDYRADWKGWRWEKLLNPEEPGEGWTANPRYFQNAASQYIYRRAMRSFRTMPSSIGSGFCYIKLKQYEENLLTSITEGLALGITGNEVFDLLEVHQ